MRRHLKDTEITAQANNYLTSSSHKSIIPDVLKAMCIPFTLLCACFFNVLKINSLAFSLIFSCESIDANSQHTHNKTNKHKRWTYPQKLVLEVTAFGGSGILSYQLMHLRLALHLHVTVYMSVKEAKYPNG